jgi:hypothetical protein
MAISPIELHSRIHQLLCSVPQANADPVEIVQWMTKADVLVEAIENDSEDVALTNAIYVIEEGFTDGKVDEIDRGLVQIRTVLTRCLYRIELTEDVAGAGEFLASGNELDAFAAVARLLRRATVDLLIVDPYLDETFLTDFMVGAHHETQVRLLCSNKNIDLAVKPALRRWTIQYPDRKIELRYCDGRTLHDRLVIVDDREVWLLSQSFNGIAKRAHAYIVQADAELSQLKRDAYQKLWSQGNSIESA